MSDSRALLADPAGEITRTQGRLSEHLPVDVLTQVDAHAARQAGLFVGWILGPVDAAISCILAEAAAHEQSTYATAEAQMPRMQAAVNAVDPRRLASALFDAPQRAFLTPYTTFLEGMCAQDARIASLRSHLTLSGEASVGISRAVVLPLSPVIGALGAHGNRVKQAIEALRPGAAEFGLGMIASIGASVLVHAMGGSIWAARRARRAARTIVGGHGQSTRFSGFLQTTHASLLEVRAALVAVLPEVQQRAHAALLALSGGLVVCAKMHLSRTRAEVVFVDLEQGHLLLKLQGDAMTELTNFAQTAVDQVGVAMTRGDWGKATTIVEEALAVFVPHRERGAVRIDGRPAVVALNELRAKVLWRASAIARRRGPPGAARILLDLVGHAPFIWDGAQDVPSAGEVARELLALEAYVEPGAAQEAARDALIVLARRTEAARAMGMPVTLSLGVDDVALVKLLTTLTGTPLPAAVGNQTGPGVLVALKTAADLSRRATAAGVKIGPTALTLRSRARRRLARSITMAAAVAAVVGTLAFGARSLWPGGEGSEATSSTAAALPTVTQDSLTSAAPPTTTTTASAGHHPVTAPRANVRPNTSVGAVAPPRTPAPVGRTTCLQACIAKCSDDSNCERTCAAGCPLS